MSSKSRLSGFNLIEAAIVLAVVGLVIGGIWVAAAKVSENRQVNETVSGVLLLHDNLKKILGPRTTANFGSTDYDTVEGLGVLQGLAGWGKSGADISTPIPGTRVNVEYRTPGYSRITIESTTVDPIPTKVCVQVISRMSGIAKSTLEWIWFPIVSETPVNFAAMPFIPTAASCTGVFWIEFRFRISG